MINYDLLPESLQDGAQRWIEDHFPPGGFLQAVISNDLKESLGRADDNNREEIFRIVSFFYNEAPSDCWGSVEKLHLWCDPKYKSNLEF